MLVDLCGWQNVSTLRAGHEWHRNRPIHIISWPTLISRVKRSLAWYPDVERLLVDECHLSIAPKMLDILEHYKKRGTIIDGYTATPARRSGKGLGRYFTEIKHVTTVRELIKQGFLCPMEYWAGKRIDVKGLKKSMGDYETGEMSKRSVKLVGDCVENWLKLASDRHTIVFAVDVAHAEALNDRFNKCGVAAGVIHSRMDTDKRAEIVRRFKAMELQVLVNVTIASYGFDDPAVNCVQICRPTLSEVLHLQMLGRGMRPGIDADGNLITDPNDPNFKVCMVLDHADNCARLGFASDLFRWSLDMGKKATGNWTRIQEDQEDPTNECADCHYIFTGSRVCPKCGWEKPFRKRDIETTDDHLVRISGQMVEPLPEGFPDFDMLYRMLIYFGREKKYNPKWANAKFKDLTGAWPERSWQQLAGVPATPRVTNYIIKEQQNYARKQSYARRSAAKAG